MTVISIKVNSLEDYFAPGGRNVGFTPNWQQEQKPA
jgi:hypothetical protein